MINFFYIMNKQGVVRLSRYYEHMDAKDRQILHSNVVRSVLERNEKQCCFFDVKGYTIIYRKYVSLYLIAGITGDENELAVLELLQNFLETLDQYFKKVTEVDIVFNTARVHMILDEMIINGCIGETSKVRALIPLQLLDAAKR